MKNKIVQHTYKYVLPEVSNSTEKKVNICEYFQNHKKRIFESIRFIYEYIKYRNMSEIVRENFCDTLCNMF